MNAKIPRNLVTLERPSARELPLQPALSDALVHELLFRTKGAGVALLAAAVLMWLIIRPRDRVTVLAFVALVVFTTIRTAGAVWAERRSRTQFHAQRVFVWFATMSLLIGGSLGAIVITSYAHLQPLDVAMCSICIVGINSAAMVSLAGSPLVYLFYVGSNMAALTFVSFAYPLAGLERPFQAMQFIYSAALFAMMRSVHRSFRNSIVLRLQLADSLSELRATQAKLMEASRRAGRADVATAVIHNVGNVLNSVNISAQAVAGIVERSRLGNLSKAATWISEHREDLGAFFRDDPRGRKLPTYFVELAAATEQDQQSMKSELKLLIQNVERISAIVQSQHSHVGASAPVETFDVHRMLTDTIELDDAYFKQHEIAVVRAFDPLPPLSFDRHNVMQIVMNLLANARDAVMTRPAGARQITVRTRCIAGNSVEISVEDNGCGIDPSNLDRIFNLGFTTKTEGHGLGLHYSACVAGALHGELTAHSEGVGTGARFSLVLPIAAEGAAPSSTEPLPRDPETARRDAGRRGRQRPSPTASYPT